MDKKMLSLDEVSMVVHLQFRDAGEVIRYSDCKMIMQAERAVEAEYEDFITNPRLIMVGSQLRALSRGFRFCTVTGMLISEWSQVPVDMDFFAGEEDGDLEEGY